MSKSKHTPGPWNIAANFHQTGRIIGSDDNAIAEVNGRKDALGQANARLIASAPDLLAVLKQILEHTSDNSGLDFDWEQFQNVLDAAREIVNKAEGNE